MAKPAFLKYLPSRLKPLSSPAVWAPLTIFVLLSAFIWEIRENPDWFDRAPVTDANPDSDLTLEEQARLSEIDTLDILLEGSRVPEDSPAATSIINPDAPSTDASEAEGNATTDDATGADATTDEDSRQLSGRADPFAPYLAEYEFSGSQNATPSTNSSATSPSASEFSAGSSSSGSFSGSNSAGSSNFNFGNGLVNPSAPATNSALSEAIGRQQARRAAAAEAESSTPQPSAISGDRPSVSNPTAGSQSPSQPSPQFSPQGAPRSSSASPQSLSPAEATGSNQTTRQSSSQPAVPTGNIPVPYIRTTPNMSPPAGTTGYQAPATSDLPVFNLPPQQPSRNPFASPRPAPTGQTTPDNTQGSTYTAPSSVQPAQNRRR